MGKVEAKKDTVSRHDLRHNRQQSHTKILLAFEDDTYLTAGRWRDSIVNLEDFSTVCNEGADRFNDWPWGLNDLWPYPAQVGAEQIRNQFGSRDVHYLVGENDRSESFTLCQEQDRIEQKQREIKIKRRKKWKKNKKLKEKRN